MASQRQTSGTDAKRQTARHRDGNCTWKKYAERHRLSRITDFPVGVTPPKKVRLYARRDHHVLQWWDKREKRTLSERVEGDLVATICRAREIDERMEHFKSSGRKVGRFGHLAVVEKYAADLQKRADAGEIDVSTVRRYSSVLRRHYLEFVGEPSVSRKCRHVGTIDRDFQLEFAVFLNSIMTSPNGHPNARARPLKQQSFIMDVVRAMLEWAADPDRGNVLPDGFRNPFARRARDTREVAPDVLSKPDISMQMAVDLLHACDRFQLAIFAPLALYGMRPGELGWLFREHIENDWLRVLCIPHLGYLTKGRRDKAFPVVGCLQPLWRRDDDVSKGLLYVNRRVDSRKVQPPLTGMPLSELVEGYRRRCSAIGKANAEHRRKVRDTLMKEAGQLGYDHIQAEFKKLSRILDWSAAATLKDLRHLFATCLENAGVPEFYRRYLMGQSFGRTPIVAYTHITEDQVKKHFVSALRSELAPIVAAIERRSKQLGI
ncbi:MAG: hypothetical protein ACC628_17560 [Pirellulaceae bacterium]